MKKIVVTGGSGRAGRAIIRELLEYGYDVLNIDVNPPQDTEAEFRAVDLTDYGQAFVALNGADAVVHMAANPMPDRDPQTGAATFAQNMRSTYNVFNAATTLGLQRIVWASSITTLGFPNERTKIIYAPMDEQHPVRPESSYALSKVIGEETARHFSRWSGIPIIGLRFALVVASESQYQTLIPMQEQFDAHKRSALWSYVDVRDVAQISRLSLEADIQGSEVFHVGAAETIMKIPSRALLARNFPDAEISVGLDEFNPVFSIEKARRMLGYEPQYKWHQFIP